MSGDSAADLKRTVAYEPVPPEPATVEGSGTYASLPATTAPGGASAHEALPAIPGYAVMGQIARGGMGVVYAARDLTLNREVAIKVLLPGLDSEAAANRFVREAQTTACLPHPAIPPVHALGTLADGSRYLVMKLIHGQTFAEHLQARPGTDADLARWVQVFEQIAQAVGFAHSQGIIHRDLKPLNVMVGAFGEVQVMDWGLAKALADSRVDTPLSEPGEAPLETVVGTVLGSPGFMAPEQARGEAVDARADVFALGGILTAILTGRAPFEGATARTTIAKAAAADLADALARLDACAADVELVALTKRCLAANPSDRPDDARAVASEVATYRAGVDARLRQAETARAAAEAREVEQRRRRRALRIAAGVIAAVLVVGIMGTTIGLVRATEAAAAERVAKIDAQEAAAAEKREREYAQAIASFVKDDFLALTSVEGQNRFRRRDLDSLDKDATLKELLDRAAAKLDLRQDLDPRIEAELRWIVGVTYRARGEYQRALPYLEQCVALRTSALGEDDPATLNAQNSLAVAYGAVGAYQKELAIFDELCERAARRFGEDHPETLGFQINRAGTLRNVGRLHQSMVLYERVRAALETLQGPDHDDVLNASGGLVLTYLAAGRTAEAIALCEHNCAAWTEKLGEDHPTVLSAYHDLARAYRLAGQTTRAIELFEQVGDARRRVLGEDDPQTLDATKGLAGAYLAVGKTSEAIALCENILAVQTKALGADHHRTLATLSDLAGAYKTAGRFQEAIPLYEQAGAAFSRTLGPDHSSTLVVLHNLAAAYQAAARLPEAITTFERVADAIARTLGRDHPFTLATQGNLAVTYRSAGKLNEAIAMMEQLREPLVAKIGADHPDALALLHNLGLTYRDLARLPEAIATLEAAREGRERKLGAEHPDTLFTFLGLALAYQDVGRLAEALLLFERAATGMERRQFRHEHAVVIVLGTVRAYEKAGRFESAEAWRRKWLAAVKERAGAESVACANELGDLGINLLRQQKWTEAETVLRDSLAIHEKKEPDGAATFLATSLLGGALLGQKKYPDAEPLLVKGYEGLRRASERKPDVEDANAATLAKQRLTEAIERLVQLYAAWGKPEDEARWRDRLKAQQTPANP